MRFGGRRLWVYLVALIVGACSTGSSLSDEASTTRRADQTTSETQREEGVDDPLPDFFVTLPPGSALPDSDQCREAVSERDFDRENIASNVDQNMTVVNTSVDIDGASPETNARFAPRITGDFTGTTEEILVWGACKWGFDEDITRARAVAESSWRMTTFGDPTNDSSECELIRLVAPCEQSYGLLQVKGTVHLGTFPDSREATAFGVDYAMAWLRSCYEGSFTWLNRQGYEVGDEWGCVGAWFSGNWYDNSANQYIDTVKGHLESETWLGY